MPMDLNPGDYTQIAYKLFYDTVDDPYFRDRDPEPIFAVLIQCQ